MVYVQPHPCLQPLHLQCTEINTGQQTSLASKFHVKSLMPSTLPLMPMQPHHEGLLHPVAAGMSS